MDIRDFIVTPLLIIVVLFAAYFIRNRVTDINTKRYFFPALIFKMMGAIALGFIYQFYYGGGDTFNYHTYGSRHLWQAFIDSPTVGLNLFFSSGNVAGGYKYASQIRFFSDSNSYFIVRIAAIFDFFTFSSYTGTAVLFSCFSFVGAWMFFLTFYNKYPHLHRRLAFACLFIPSTIFWGSGILKDTIVLACLGILTFEINRLMIEKKISLVHILLLIVSTYFIFSIKKFVLQAYFPCALMWVYLSNLSAIRSTMARAMILPILIVLILVGGYYSVLKIGEGDRKYSLEKISSTAQITAYDIRYYTGRNAGSGYELGELDGSISSMIKLGPAAINVSLFRPYLWEVRNPLMAITALESFIFLVAAIYLFFLTNFSIFKSIAQPDVLFCFLFALIFAFGVGVSTFNFGTLSRYRIPLLPFFFIALILLNGIAKSDKKLVVLETTE